MVSRTVDADLVLPDERREELGVGRLRRFDRVAVERDDDVADLQPRGLRRSAEDARDAHAGPARKAEPLGQLARQHLHGDRHPRLARFEPGILEPGPAELDDRQQALAGALERDERRDALLLAARQRLDALLERFERRRSACSSSDHNHVVLSQRRLRLVGRTAGTDAAHADAVAARALQLLRGPAGEVRCRDAQERNLADSRVDALALGRRDRERLLGAVAEDDGLDRLADRQPHHELVEHRHFLGEAHEHFPGRRA